MIYKVRATYLEEKAAEFYLRLTDDSIANQRPDGPEIMASMQRARIVSPGTIEWYEMCFCPTPLQHERITVYDHYLENLTTKLVDDYGDITGESFWEYLKLAKQKE